MGSLANARHDFRAGLRYGERARAAAPGVVKPYGVIVDAQVELGRYDAAERTLQRMVDLKPNLDSYARVSYFRELHGDLPGAVEAMRLAASAGGDARENLAYVQTLIGNLELARGRTADAERAYRLALSRYPGYVPAQAGLARADVAPRRPRRGDPPLPRRGHAPAACPSTSSGSPRRSWPPAAAPPRARTSRWCEVQQRLLRRGGVNVDAEMAIVEADHGSPRARGRAGAARLDARRRACAAPTRSAGR